MSKDVYRDNSDWVCARCGRRFFKEKDARVHLFVKHKKKRGRKDKGARIRYLV